jgi:hypothetical protein
MGVGGHCACLHWGLRRSRTYADPMFLLRAAIVLKPLTLKSGARVSLLEGRTQALD